MFELKRNKTDCASETVADLLLLSIFTGMRRGEVLPLTWQSVDMDEKTLIVENTKNGEPLELPLCEFIYELLNERKTKSNSEFVFPGDGVTGHINDPRKQMNKVIKRSGVKFALHDLRRTFITIAESLDISMYAIKRLVNHKITNDVTAGYIVMDPERLRVPMERISKFLIHTISGSPEGKIISLDQVKSNSVISAPSDIKNVFSNTRK